MMPENQARRMIIREWMLQPRDKRQTAEQAAAFATKVMPRVPTLREPHERIMRWLLPRLSKR